MYPNTVQEALCMIIDLQREQIHNIKEIHEYQKELERLKVIIQQQQKELNERRPIETLSQLSDSIPQQKATFRP